MFLSAFVSSLFEIPLSLYQTFILEAKHGFNKTTPYVFVTDLIKTWILSVALGTPILALFLYIFEWAGDSFVPSIMAFLLV